MSTNKSASFSGLNSVHSTKFIAITIAAISLSAKLCHVQLDAVVNFLGSFVQPVVVDEIAIGVNEVCDNRVIHLSKTTKHKTDTWTLSSFKNCKEIFENFKTLL